ARQTPAQLDSWEVTFEQLPDGLLLDRNEPTTVQEGAVYQPQYGFYNYTDAAFGDSLEVAYSVFNRDSRSFFADTIKIPAPAVGDTVNFSPTFATVGFVGINDLTVKVNVNGVAEQYVSNNLIRRSAFLQVERDNVNPVLDVTFDGRYIKDGEIIAPNPTISVRLKDENPFFLKSDTVGVLLFLKEPCEGCDFEQVFFDDESITWFPATEDSDFQVMYRPRDLLSGFYGLRVLAQDASGNDSGEEPFEINFSIATEPSIADFTPFPNPFRDGVRFAFTLTGTTPPEDMSIEIFTLTGQLIRKVQLTELGELNIGQNITEAVWDGTDSQGQSVTNGIYLYRVKLTRGGEVVDGKFFENGIGRLYLLR
ncbi:MAG: FlgD immunoglobulin-like domain containing protein, partial [Bacteroidota bacterium]